ncbi:MAG: hypothetical protein AMXMBFR83_14420 [Phycisphaerae bacterium]
MPHFTHDGLPFHYLESGAGTPFVFQHGLGADASQPLGLFRPPAGVRLLCFDCRAHGRTPVGDENKLGFVTFADDLAAFLDHLGLERAVIGGISMGAGVAVNFALRYPRRVRGLVLSRPAWLAWPKPETVRWCATIARLIREHGPARGKEAFLLTPDYAEARRESPDVAASGLRQFDDPRAVETVARLERIPPDAPCRSLDELAAIAVPTLVLAHHQDPVHPFAYGQALAAAIPGAVLREIASKSVSVERHTADVQRHIETFLQELPD